MIMAIDTEFVDAIPQISRFEVLFFHAYFARYDSIYSKQVLYLNKFGLFAGVCEAIDETGGLFRLI